MRQSGRVTLVTLVLVMAVVVFVAVLVLGREGLSAKGARFMSALAKGDVDTLTKMSYLPGKTDDEVRKEWEFSTGVPGKHYAFAWKIMDSREADEKSGSVRVSVMRNLFSGAAYDENFQLPLVKVNGEWKVNISGISREMYPGLPRSGAK